MLACSILYCRTAVGAGLAGAIGVRLVIGCGGSTGRSLPTAAGGMIGPAGAGGSSAVRTAATATGFLTADAALDCVEPFRVEMLGVTGIKFEVLGPGVAAGAAGTGAPADGTAGGAMPPAGVIPPVG